MWLIIVNGYMHCKFIMIVTVVIYYWAFLRAQLAKNQPAMQKTPFQFLGQEDPLEKGKATYSSILAGRIPWTEEPGGLEKTE